MEASKRREYSFSSFCPESGILGRWCFQGHVTPLVTARQGGSGGLAGKQLLSTRGHQPPLFRSLFGNPGRPLALLCWTGPPASIFRPSMLTLSAQAWRPPLPGSGNGIVSWRPWPRPPLGVKFLPESRLRGWGKTGHLSQSIQGPGGLGAGWGESMPLSHHILSSQN